MPLPKRRHSKTRRDKRRTHLKLAAPNFFESYYCNETKLSLHACPICGYYKDRMVFVPKES